MPLQYEQNVGATALDQQTHLDREQGYAVIPASGHAVASGGDCEVTTNTGTLGTGNNALSVASGSVLFGGAVTSVASQTIDINTGDVNPRKDVVYIDSNGSAQVREGSPAAVPSEAPGNRFQTWKPAPYDMHDIDGVVLATVWVADGASAVGSADLRDRRLSADRVVGELDSSEVTTKKSVTVSGDDTITYGRDHGQTVEGDNVVVGVGARALEDVNQTASGNDPRKVAVGYESARFDEQFATTAAGYRSAANNTGNRIAAVGYRAAEDNPGNHIAAVGYKALENNTHNSSVGVGYKAGRGNTGKGAVTMGYKAGEFNDGSGAFCIGFQAGQNNTGNNAVALGNRAGRANSAPKLVAVGFRAGQDNSGDNVSASGVRAAQNNISDNVVVRGVKSAQDNTGKNLVAAGHLTAQDNTGDNVTALGHLAARYNYANDVVAIGNLSSRNNTGDRTIAIGISAARGDGLADPTTMGSDNIGIGDSAIRNNQASGLIGIGQEAGRDAQTDDQMIVTQRNGTRRMVMDLTTGDLKISGSLTENATL